MKPKLKFYNVSITNCAKENRNFLRLYGVFKNTINTEMSFSEFRNYYYSEKLQYIDVTFCYFNAILVGFCSAAFYQVNIKGKKVILGRAATGILSDYQRNGLPKLALFFKYVRYKYHNPFAKLIISAFVANAIIYAMICKYTAWVWPRVDSKTPGYVDDVKMEIMKSSQTAVQPGHTYIVKANFKVMLGDALMERIYNSTSRHIKYFLKLNPEFYQQYCLIVIIPFSWANLFGSLMLFLFYNCSKQLAKVFSSSSNKWF